MVSKKLTVGVFFIDDSGEERMEKARVLGVFGRQMARDGEKRLRRPPGNL